MIKNSIIVSSCDAFMDCWEPFIYSVKKYWQDMPCEMYIVSNHLSIDDEKVKFIKVGDDKGWASNLKVALREIESEYILYLQEDYWLVRTVDTDKFLSQIDYCEKNGVDYLRLNIPFSDNTNIDNLHAACSLDKDKYGICLQAAIWKKATLEQLLIEGWSGWDYEAKACRYVIDNNIAINAQVVLSGADDIILYYVDGTAVRKGKWTRPGAAFLKENGFIGHILKRETEGWLISHLAKWRNIALLRLPSSVTIRSLNLLRWNI